MPPPTEQTSQYYRDGCRGYLSMMFLMMIFITTLVMFNASDNWPAIIACMVCLLMLGVRLAYAQYLWRQTHRPRQELPATSPDINDSYYTYQSHNLPDHLRTPDDELVFGEYAISMEEERQRQQVFTISRGHDLPPDYDTVTKDQRPPRLSHTVRVDDIPGTHHPNSYNTSNSLQSSSSRQEADSRSDPNISSPNNLSREHELTQADGRILENSDSFDARVGVPGGDDSQLPPSYDEALAARMYQQLGMENG